MPFPTVLLSKEIMSIETGNFTFEGIRFKYAESNTISSNGQKSSPIRTGIMSVDVRCKSCGHEWQAREYGEGNFRSAIGQILFECPACSSEEKLRTVALMKS